VNGVLWPLVIRLWAVTTRLSLALARRSIHQGIMMSPEMHRLGPAAAAILLERLRYQILVAEILARDLECRLGSNGGTADERDALHGQTAQRYDLN
jgi:hypothetical protein